METHGVPVKKQAHKRPGSYVMKRGDGGASATLAIPDSSLLKMLVSSKTRQVVELSTGSRAPVSSMKQKFSLFTKVANTIGLFQI